MSQKNNPSPIENSLWRLISDGPHSPSANMARDEALWRLSPVPVLRFYRWAVPCFSIGYFQRVTECGIPVGVSFVRRPTGGGVVDHSSDFTYTISLPPDHFLAQARAAESYRQVHEAVALGLRKSGIDANLAPCCARRTSTACFENPVKFDLMLGTQKIGGSAQRRTKWGLLLQGSLVLPSRPTSLESSLESSFKELFQCTFEPSVLTSEEVQLATTLDHSQYSAREWNYKYP
ncbi:MAG: lipoate--protein ligase family protein [Verrucomicrobiota bacterium]|nr:lipoate--protein ligase family protein [Verrucomicrobiota bacterium]